MCKKCKELRKDRNIWRNRCKNNYAELIELQEKYKRLAAQFCYGLEMDF